MTGFGVRAWRWLLLLPPGPPPFFHFLVWVVRTLSRCNLELQDRGLACM